MIGIIIIISFLFILLKACDKVYTNDKTVKQSLFVLLWLIIGLRYEVGIDYHVYEEMYNDPNDVNNLAIEPFWHYFNKTLRWIGFKSRMYFLITSGFTMFCFYKAINYLSPDFFLSAIILFVIGFYFETANTVRQCCAMGAIFWGYTYLQKNELWKMIILFILAISLHLSAIFGVFLILFSTVHINKWLLVSLLLMCFLLGENLMNLFVIKFMPVLADVGQYNYAVNKIDDGISSGILKYIYTFCGSILILLYNNINQLNKYAYRFINLTIYGICIYCVFYTFQPARRLYMYAFIFSTIVFPYFFRCFQFKSRIIPTSFVIIVFLLFLIKANLSVPYSFDFNII